ncbi:MAG: hypothetical protein JXA97_01845 [Anaerolineales bacterium]|nr:hypothetical protein [Anaerolineales bacterium]
MLTKIHSPEALHHSPVKAQRPSLQPGNTLPGTPSAIHRPPYRAGLAFPSADHPSPELVEMFLPNDVANL